MSIPVRQMLVSKNKHSIKCPYDMQAEYITVHNTYNNASANNEVQYMAANTNKVSFHYAVDDKEVVQGILTNRNAFHCGDGNGAGNRKSIGVEICYSKSGGERYKRAESLAIRFLAQLLRERGWGVNKLKQHYEWSGKNCPHRIRDEGRWGSFVAAVQKELNTKEDKPMNPKLMFENKTIPSLLIDGRTYVQVRELAELLGLKIVYNNETKTTKLFKEVK